jgi:hypothetical protein
MTRPGRALLLIPLIFGALALRATANDAGSQITAEIERLRKSLNDKPGADASYTELASTASSMLQSAASAAEAGRLYASLEGLARAEDLVGGARAIVDRAELATSGVTAFDAAWGAVSLRLAASDREAHARRWGRAPVAIRALAEAAQGRAIPLLDGARGFASANGPSDGLFYIGQAEGEAAFARFCATLSATSGQRAFPLRSFLPELQALQARATAAFQPPKSIDLHTRFIALNSAIKLAQELDATRFFAGALYQYLEATRHYGMLDQPPVDPARTSELTAALAAARERFAASPNDDSIAELFLERAESQLVHADGSPPTADEWRSARVILDQLLPAYENSRRPGKALQRTSAKTVEITLVRWPYT